MKIELFCCSSGMIDCKTKPYNINAITVFNRSTFRATDRLLSVLKKCSLLMFEVLTDFEHLI